MKEKKLAQILDIKAKSPYELNQELKEYSRQGFEFSRMYAEINRKVNDKNLELEILVAEIVDRIRKQEKTPPSAVGELRKTRVPLDKEYQEKKKELNELLEQRDVLNGLVKFWEMRGYRLKEMVELALYYEPKVSVDERIKEANKKLK